MKKQKIIITFIILIFLLPMQSKALNDTNTLINTENEEKTESTTKITQEDIEKQESSFEAVFLLDIYSITTISFRLLMVII